MVEKVANRNFYNFANDILEGDYSTENVMHQIIPAGLASWAEGLRSKPPELWFEDRYKLPHDLLLLVDDMRFLGTEFEFIAMVSVLKELQIGHEKGFSATEVWVGRKDGVKVIEIGLGFWPKENGDQINPDNFSIDDADFYTLTLSQIRTSAQLELRVSQKGIFKYATYKSRSNDSWELLDSPVSDEKRQPKKQYTISSDFAAEDQRKLRLEQFVHDGRKIPLTRLLKKGITKLGWRNNGDHISTKDVENVFTIGDLAVILHLQVPKEIAETETVLYCSKKELDTARSLIMWGDDVHDWAKWFVEIRTNNHKIEHRFVRLLVES